MMKFREFFTHVPPPVIPREHGAWVMLLVPLVAAAGIARRLDGNFLLLSTASLAMFLGSVPLQTVYRYVAGIRSSSVRMRQAVWWSLAYGRIGLVALSVLLARGYPFLLILGGGGCLALLFSFEIAPRYPQSIVRDLVGAAGLSLGAPAAWYVLMGRIDPTLVVLWLFHLLFFSFSVFYVRLKIDLAGHKKSKGGSGKVSPVVFRTLIAFLFLFLVLFMLASTGVIQWPAVAAFVPIALHVLPGSLRISTSTSFKRLGLFLVLQSLLFASLLTFLRA
jgi:hypothetical protein